MAVSMKVTNTSRTVGEREEGTDLTFRLSLPVQRKRKRHLEKQNVEPSARLSSEAEKRLGDRYERPEGSGKAPTNPDVVFM
jgi:hypothetical protein